MVSYRLPFYRSFLFQLSVLFSILGIVPMVLVSYLNYNYGSRILNDTTAAGLYAIAQYQSENIQDFMRGVQKDVHLLAETPTFVEALEKIFEASKKKDPLALEELEYGLNTRFMGVFKRFTDELSFKTIFLASPDGQALYNTSEKAFIEETNPKMLGHKRQLLVKTLELTYMVMSPQVSDFGLNAKEEDPSLLFTCPVFSKGVLIGLLAVEVSSQSIYTILNNYTGLDETGETVISQQKNDRVIVLNPTRNAKDLVFEEDTFAKQENSAMYKALRGERGFGPGIDYRGKSVLAAWEYLPRLRWGLVVKKDLSEVLNPSVRLQNIMFSIVLPSVGVLALIAFFLGKRISTPIADMVQNAERLAAGNVEGAYTSSPSNNELKLLSRALYTLQAHLRSLASKARQTEVFISNLQSKAFHTSYVQTKLSHNYKSFLRRISRFSHHADSLNKGLMHTLKGLVQVANKGALDADASQHKLKTLRAIIDSVGLSKASLEGYLDSMHKQVKVLQGIFFNTLKMADRSNILALNTTLEVHQMSHSTLGFRRVAQDIQKMSQEIDDACLEVETTTQGIEQAMNQAHNALKQFAKMVHEESHAVDLMHTYLEGAIEHISYLPEPLKRALTSLEKQAESIQGLENAIQTMQELTGQQLEDLEAEKISISSLKAPKLNLEKEVAELKT